MNALAPSLLSFLLCLAAWADGWLGVYLSEAEQPTIDEVIPGSPAAKAGLKPGDRFLTVDGVKVATRDDFIDKVRSHGAGDKVRFELQRDGRKLTVEATLAERPDEDEIPSRTGGEQPEAGKPAAEKQGPPAARPGLTPRAAEPKAQGKAAPAPAGEPAPADEPPYLGLRIVEAEKGLEVEVVVPESPAQKAGIAVGDVLTKWGDHEVRTLRDLDKLLRGCKSGDQAALLFQSGGGTKSVLLTLGKRPAQTDAKKPAGQAAPAQQKKPAPSAAHGQEPRATDRKPEPPAGAPAPSERPLLGVTFGETDEGLVVQSVVEGGPANKAGVAEGDVLVAIGKDETSTADDLVAAMQKRKPGEKVELRIRRDGEERKLQVTLGRRPAEGAAAAPGKGPGERGPRAEAAAPALPGSFRHDFAAALEEAGKADRPLLACYGANWNSGSQAQRGALAKAAAEGILDDVVCVAVDADKNGELLEERGIGELPAFELIVGGKVANKHTGYLPVDGLKKFVAKVPGKAGPTGAKPQPKAPSKTRPDAPKSAADLDQEIEALRKELQEVRRLLEELRKKDGAKKE